MTATMTDVDTFTQGARAWLMERAPLRETPEPAG